MILLNVLYFDKIFKLHCIVFFMFNKREWIIFFAGFEALHTLAHMGFALSGILPINIFGINVTYNLDLFAIIFNLIVTILLLFWASKVKRR